jgi:ubiquinone/menaquinone biosynthesis C-methylase UbiE
MRDPTRPVKPGTSGASSGPPPETIGPAAYARWRATTLGAVTEALEQRVMLELIGPLESKRVLDLGCGDGLLTTAFAGRGASAVGIDIDPAMLRAAIARPTLGSGRRVHFVQGRIERLPFPDAIFDVVIVVSVLCFVSDRTTAVREAARVLRPGGRLVMGELGRWSAWAVQRRVRGWLVLGCGAPRTSQRRRNCRRLSSAQA